MSARLKRLAEFVARTARAGWGNLPRLRRGDGLATGVVGLL